MPDGEHPGIERPTIGDPFAERENFNGSDRSRIHIQSSGLTPDDISWTVLSGQPRIDAETALEILADAG